MTVTLAPTKICIEKTQPTSSYVFQMPQLQSFKICSMIEGLQGSPIPCFGLFSPLVCPDFPLFNFSLYQVANQDLHRKDITNVKSPFPNAPTTIFCHLRYDRRVRRVPHSMFWFSLTNAWPSFPTDQLWPLASCQSMHRKCIQIDFPKCSNYNLLSSLVW